MQITDVSYTPRIRGAQFWPFNINQLYHPTGIFAQDSQDIVYSYSTLNITKFGPILLKEWFFLVKEGGYLIIDYQPNERCDFTRLEEMMWWLWKQKYTIVYHGPIDESDLNVEPEVLSKYVQDKESFGELARDSRTLLSPPMPSETLPRTKDGHLRLICRKTHSTKIKGDSIDKWTFGIITNGKRDDWMELCIKSIRKQKIPNYEIIVCGTYFDRNEDDFKYIPFNQRDDRGWITKKKNLIVSGALYENLCIVHDRIIFSDSWYKETKKYGNCFEFLCNAQYYNDMRVYDWVTIGGSNPHMYRTRLLDRRDWDWWGVIGGCQIISKKSILEKVPLNETRHWNEAEDVEFSFKMRDSGYIVRINNARVESLGFRFGLLPSRPFGKRFYWPDMLLRRILGCFARGLRKFPTLHNTVFRIFCTLGFYRKVTRSSITHAPSGAFIRRKGV